MFLSSAEPITMATSTLWREATMDLILWRHAEAQQGRNDLNGLNNDMERPLTAKGKRQAASMAKWLEKHLPDSTKVLTSPAVRAMETARALDRKFKSVPSLAPGADVASLLIAADWPESRQPVLIVGHQPTIGHLASLLLFGSEHDMSIRKGSVWWFTNRSREDDNKVMLRTAVCPDYL
jgi:phosphohistidine phosphatase